MPNNDTTLFVFEGAKAETKLIEKLEKNFFRNKLGIKCVFEAEIYQLYEAIKSEKEFAVDIVNLLKERSETNSKLLAGYNRDSFAYVYLFFDYDAHSTLADDAKIRELLSFFDNETINGLLFISYPMVEALRHYKDLESFRYLLSKCKGANCPNRDNCQDKDVCMAEPHYKRQVSEECLPRLCNVNAFDFDV